jgi:hypothetical protein
VSATRQLPCRYIYICRNTIIISNDESTETGSGRYCHRLNAHPTDGIEQQERKETSRTCPLIANKVAVGAKKAALYVRLRERPADSATKVPNATLQTHRDKSYGLSGLHGRPPIPNFKQSVQGPSIYFVCRGQGLPPHQQLKAALTSSQLHLQVPERSSVPERWALLVGLEFDLRKTKKETLRVGLQPEFLRKKLFSKNFLEIPTFFFEISTFFF